MLKYLTTSSSLLSPFFLLWVATNIMKVVVQIFLRIQGQKLSRNMCESFSYYVGNTWFHCSLFLFQIHCLQFLIYEAVSGGNMRKPGGLFGNAASEIPANDLKQLETFFYKLSFFLHMLDYTGLLIFLYNIFLI